MSKVSLFRKYRSQTFNDLIGQEHIVRTLQAALTSGNIAQAYLFTGPRGTGKTSSARLLAKCLCCESGPAANPCNDCEQCRSITTGSHMDVVEMDAASEASVDDVREKIVEVAEYQPMMARYKVFIIDEVHDLSAKAFDALLKTIEEPPAHLIFILATTEYNKVPATIRSRCQKYEFHRGSLTNLIERLNHVAECEGVQAEPSAISAIARMADGGYRDALTLLEQAMLVSGGNITLDVVYDQLGLISESVIDEILLAIADHDVSKLIVLLDDIARSGRDPRAVLESLLHRTADLTRASFQVGVDQSDVTRHATMHELSTRLGRDFLLQIRASIADAHKLIRDISLPKLWLESELIRLATAKVVELRVASGGEVRTNATAEAKPVDLKPASSKERATKSAPVVVEPEASPPESGRTPRAPSEGLTASAELNALLGAIPANTAIALKLANAELVSREGDEFVIALTRKMDIAWMTEVKRMGFLIKTLQASGISEPKITFVHQSKGGDALDSEAVELPAEGARLEQLLKKTFNLNGEDSTAS